MNYCKAYCTVALPDFENLPAHVRDTHRALCPLVGDLKQTPYLDIPMDKEIEEHLQHLNTEELARLSRASYYVGYWFPGTVRFPFSNTKGESWKVSNCCDQMIKRRLKLPKNIEVHEGIFRVTYSNTNTWLWHPFGLATEENLQKFLNCGLSFTEKTLHTNAETLKNQINDLYPDEAKDNELYLQYMYNKQETERKELFNDYAQTIKDLNKKAKEAEKCRDFKLLCNSLKVPIDNLIYYRHTDEFSFGWRKPYSEEEKKDIINKLSSVNHPYRYTVKIYGDTK
jgi:hypothetical protein